MLDLSQRQIIFREKFASNFLLILDAIWIHLRSYCNRARIG